VIEMAKKKKSKRNKPKSKSTQKPVSKTPTKSSSSKGLFFKIGIPLVFLLAVYLLYFTKDKEKLQQTQRPTPNQVSSKPLTEPQFKKEGELVFLEKESQKEIRKIDIEIAEKSLERQQGLMYRKSMPDSVGMLFIFEREELQSFWMKDTYISLDILYVSEDNEIMTIYRNTKPRSEESLFSYKNSKYVVEVIGGFCDNFKIKEGDFIRFEKK
jgi:uncharacterized membrane protein (UPF0127 family)